MRALDIIKLSQSNLLKSKLRTSLTILAVFIGTFTISMTNGVGNGIRAYIDKQLGNVGVENTLIIQAKQTQANPVSADVFEYDPNKTSGMFNIALLGPSDILNINSISGVDKVTPNYDVQISYITVGGKKYEAAVSQFIVGLNLDLEAGRTVDGRGQVTVPTRYIKPLGYKDGNDAIGKELSISYKNSNAEFVTKSFKIVGVQQQALLGNSSLYLDAQDIGSIYADQTAGQALRKDTYQALLVSFNKNFTDERIVELKQLFNANGYEAATIEDQIGTVSKVIDTALIVLNVFGAIALLAAAFGIVNTLLMSVNERTSEIGLMKALGANSQTVFATFSLEAASIGFWGGLLGIGSSMIVGLVINKIATNTFLKDFTGFDLLYFPVVSTLLTLLGIIILAYLAGALPSLKASKLDPIKALRYE